MSDALVIRRSATKGRSAVLQIEGRLDAKTATELRVRGAEVAAEGRNLVLNLKGVTFMGSSGLGAILALSEEFQEQAGQVHLTELSEAARQVAQLVSLERVVPIHPDEASALKSLEAA